MNSKPIFHLQKTSSYGRSRAGCVETAHGKIQTPVFMPVGTQAAVKALRFEDLRSVDTRIMLSNTYHLMLRPGIEVFRKLKGIHRFMNWDRAVLTDSGGYQVFSLTEHCKIDESGARFRSMIDGQHIVLTPETSIEMQNAIGSDIMMVFDHCVPSTSSFEISNEAMERTHRWALRSLQRHQELLKESPFSQSLFAILQGACFPHLRRQSAAFLTEHPFDGFAIGGLAVGESKSEREDFTELCTELMPKDKPRYLMGVGTPIDLLEAIHRGVDMFDCIFPTAIAQQGIAFTSTGRVSLRRGIYKFVEEPLDSSCHCLACKNYSRAYLHHLIKAQELLGWQMVAHHNLHFYFKLMHEARASILEDCFEDFYQQKRARLVLVDEEYPVQFPN